MLLGIFQFHPRFWSRKLQHKWILRQGQTMISQKILEKFHCRTSKVRFATCVSHTLGLKPRIQKISLINVQSCLVAVTNKLSKHHNQLQLLSNSVARPGIKASACCRVGLSGQNIRTHQMFQLDSGKTQVPGQHIQRFQVVIQNFKQSSALISSCRV